jgi:ferrous iron transport protein A
VVATAEFVSVISTGVRSLVDLPAEMAAIVDRIDATAISPGVARRLAEIGFLPGEAIRVLARVPGGNPIAVRIGSSTFALRRHEAACVLVHAQQVLTK